MSKGSLGFLGGVALVLLGGAVVLFGVGRGALYPQSVEQDIQKIVEPATEFLIQELRRNVVTPPPLRRAARAKSETLLTPSGIVAWTNEARRKNDLPGLSDDEALHDAALRKGNDILQQQYFAHTSPDGVGAAELAREEGYEYLLIGENLALGGFEDDDDMVLSWMESPGHRANILNASFSDIGVGVVRGEFEGDTVWVGVQIFGTPKSLCPEPSKELLRNIKEEEDDLRRRYEYLEQERNDIEGEEGDPGPAYRERVENYNRDIRDYNALVEETQDKIEEYNSYVEVFRECVRRFTFLLPHSGALYSFLSKQGIV